MDRAYLYSIHKYFQQTENLSKDMFRKKRNKIFLNTFIILIEMIIPFNDYI